MEALLASLPVPIAVAVVASFVTALLSSRRAREDRLAALRLETYRDLVILSKRWGSGVRASHQAEVSGEDFEPHMAAWAENADKLIDQMSLLPIVARRRAYERIEGAFQRMSQANFEVDTDSGGAELERTGDLAEKAMEAFIATVTAEARREIRRTGA